MEMEDNKRNDLPQTDVPQLYVGLRIPNDSNLPSVVLAVMPQHLSTHIQLWMSPMSSLKTNTQLEHPS